MDLVKTFPKGHKKKKRKKSRRSTSIYLLEVSNVFRSRLTSWSLTNIFFSSLSGETLHDFIHGFRRHLLSIVGILPKTLQLFVYIKTPFAISWLLLYVFTKSVGLSNICCQKEQPNLMQSEEKMFQKKLILLAVDACNHATTTLFSHFCSSL